MKPLLFLKLSRFLKSISLTVTSAAILFSANASQAQTLKEVMMQMGQTFGTLAKQVSDPAKNTSSLVLAANLENLSLQAINIKPSKVQTLAEPLQSQQFIVYKRMINQIFTLSLDLEESLLNNDNVAAQATAKKIQEAIKQGHSMFK